MLFSISQSKSDQNKEMWHDKKCINFKWYLNRQDIKYYDLKKKKKKRCQLHWSFMFLSHWISHKNLLTKQYMC